MTTSQEISAPRTFATDYQRVWHYFTQAETMADVYRQIDEACPINRGNCSSLGLARYQQRRANDLKALAREIQADHERACRAPRGGVDLSRIGGC